MVAHVDCTPPPRSAESTTSATQIFAPLDVDAVAAGAAPAPTVATTATVDNSAATRRLTGSQPLRPQPRAGAAATLPDPSIHASGLRASAAPAWLVASKALASYLSWNVTAPRRPRVALQPSWCDRNHLSALLACKCPAMSAWAARAVELPLLGLP